MWEGQDPDPGGTKVPPSVQELSELKDQNEQQLVLIAQLKEMLRKEQSHVSEDKVEEYVNNIKKAVKRSRQKREDASSSGTVNEANKKGRVNLLRQQLEENKARLAERGKSQKGIEEMVTQLQAQLKDSQSLVTSSSLNASLVDPKQLEYNENTTQKELYNILLTKEKKITELLNKSQKLEGTVLDLQENLKEKDSVIDARTKAITLMTDSLSKKGKSTLDALDETKEQMRKMQEHFVTLEAEMKARQLALLNDLKVKNFEIGELQELNLKLERDKSDLELRLTVSPAAIDSDIEDFRKKTKLLEEENNNLLQKIKMLEVENENNLSKIAVLDETSSGIAENQGLLDEIHDLKSQLDAFKQLEKENANNLVKIDNLEKQLEEALNDLKILKNAAASSRPSAQEENEEIVKLKKQLDESNKNTIKMRANQKAKIKELNKKLEQFKKMGDANVLISQLQNENTKLNEKIAELEDEKGNLQLKMVDSTSSKEDYTELDEELKQLKSKLETLEQESDQKNKIIEILDEEVLALKSELKERNEQEAKVNSQISSEMTSVCYEEQIEKLELEQKELFEQIDQLKLEKEALFEELESSKKEKQELNSKLNLYIQENMDLIDKLEKLSNEKVSSVESIEIVEGLTQQEKLELAAYQKHLNPEDSLKCPEDDLTEPPVELNETVLQLNEDTAELLQKIDMFTQERKEVMQKMEALKEENDTLTLRVKEVENNRDILEETYEALQNEKDAIQDEKLKLEDLLQKDEQSAANALAQELKDLQTKYQALIEENDQLKRSLKSLDFVVQEKDDLETQLRDAVENNSSLDTKLNSNLDEINTYQLAIEENKTELVNSGETIHKLRQQLEERENDIKELHISISELNSVISELQSKQADFESIEAELDDLKSGLTHQIAQAQDYESEIAQNNETIKNLNEQLVKCSKRIIEIDNELEERDKEMGKLINELRIKQALVEDLQMDQKFMDEIRQKYQLLQGQLNDNQKRMDEMSHKNKEQLEKMKKLAANLKKKSQAYQELEEQTNSLFQENATLKLQLQQEKQQRETSLQQEMSASLHEEFDPNFSSSSNATDKVRELELQLETKEIELDTYKSKVEKLHEDSRKLQDNNAQLELANAELTEKLNSAIDSFKEKAFLEDQLELRLAEVSANDELLAKQLQESRQEREELTKKQQEQEDLIKRLKIKLKKAHDKVTELKGAQDTVQELETANGELKGHLSALEETLKHIQQENETLRLRNMADYERIEIDYQSQLTELLKTKNELSTENEKLLEKIQQFEAREQEMASELEEYKSKIEQIESSGLEELKLLKDQLENEKSNSQTLNVQLQESSIDNQKLTNDLNILRGELEIEKSTNQFLNIQLEELRENIRKVSEELRLVKDQFENEKLTNQTLNAQLQQNAHKLTEELSLLQDQFENEKSTNKILNVQLQEWDENIRNLTEENQQLHKQINALEFANSTLEASCESFQIPPAQQLPSPEDLPTFKGAGHLQLECQPPAPSDSLLRMEIEDLKSQLTVANHNIECLQEKLAPAATVQYSQVTLPTFNWPGDQQETENQFLIGTTVLPGSESDLNFKEIEKLQQELNILQIEKSAEIEDLNKKLSISTQEVRSLQEENQRLQKELPHQFEKSSEIKDLQVKLLKSSQDLQSALSNFDSLKHEVSNLQEEIKHLEMQRSSELQDLNNQLIASKEQFESALKKSSELQNELEKLKLESATSQPQQHIQSFQNYPVDESAVQQTTVPLFSAFADNAGAGSAFDQLEPIQEKPVFAEQVPVVEHGKEALLQKIKALEFLLYNVDKEKEIALEQCTDMVNELTRLVYEKSDLDSQILPPEIVESLSSDRQTLKRMEYTPTNKNSGLKNEPVIEEVIEPKKAYVCFDDEEKKIQLQDFESQIVSNEAAAKASNKRDLQKLEYEVVSKSVGEQKQSVVEPLVQPKHAYLCFTKEEKSQDRDENDDGWCWGPEEARLEEEHLSTLENIPQVKTLQAQIEQLEDTIKVLQVERENHLEEIKQLQIKSGKLLKKCKELKASQSSSKRPGESTGFFDLNETIQDELKTQVAQLEKKLRELTADHEKEKAEKNNLLKRVDVLTAANERMVEMKEIQDSEVLRWQRKHQEVLQKLQEHEWGSGEFEGAQKPLSYSSQPAEPSEHTQSVKELEETIRELQLDNDELQSLLEEQTAKRIEAEKNKKGGSGEQLAELQAINQNLHSEIEKLSSELNEKLLSKEKEIKQLQEQVQVLSNQITDLEQNLERITYEKGLAEVEFHEKIRKDEENTIACNQEREAQYQKIVQDLEVVIAELQARIREIESRENESEIIQENSQVEPVQEQHVLGHAESKVSDNSYHDIMKDLASKIQEIKQLQEQVQVLSNQITDLEQNLERVTYEKGLAEVEFHEKIRKGEENTIACNQERESQYQKIVQDLEVVIAELQARISEIESREKESEIIQENSQVEPVQEQHVLGYVESKVAENSYHDIMKDLASKIQEIEVLQTEKLSKDTEVQRLLAEIQTKEDEFQKRVKELNEMWQIQVDQRGSDVAESWKMHLEMVEKDFLSVQDKLKNDLLHMEEKCTALASENSELKKSVDQEIRHEVEKISELQQEIRDKDRQIQEMYNNLSNYAAMESQLQTLRNENLEKDQKLASINIIIETTQKQFDEKREVLEAIVAILEKHASNPISYDKDDIIGEFERQFKLIDDSEQAMQKLRDDLTRITGEKSREINGLNQVIEDLEKELGVVHEKEAEIVRLTSELAKLDAEHSNCTTTIQSIQQTLEERNLEIERLNYQLLQVQETKVDSNIEVENLNNALSRAKDDYATLQASLAECQRQLYETSQQLAEKCEEVRLANEKILQNDQSYSSHYSQEFARLQEALHQKEGALKDLQSHYEELLSNKDIDINALKVQMQELTQGNQLYNERLIQEETARQQLEQQLNERTQLVDEDTKQLEELKLIIEEQVTKIEELKKELFNKSNQYDSLIAEMDVGRQPPPVTQQPAKLETGTKRLDADDLSELVSRAELDVTLYMLHQRDVRCEELTDEIRRLLEERDTLQLRLSNALREKEELKKSFATNPASSASGDSSQDAAAASSSDISAALLAAAETKRGKEALESDQNLATKLSELKLINYKRDKTYVDEQEARRLQQLAIMQEHISEAAKLPPEAAARLVDASYTLSRDVQSPSKVLLNWLWGKSPPKANDS